MRARAEPLEADTFAALMAPFGPFEAKPELAVAVSGGRDSMALILLADEWARRRGGQVVGLTVDHGLRRESAAEARRVGRWLRQRGVAHRTLLWRGPKATAGLQFAARQARHALLTSRCRRAGILHLLMAHQMEDQAETYLMRRARGSGLTGLAAMSALRSAAGVRLLRPLLTVPRRQLQATLEFQGQAWLDDPSNEDPAFERTGVRRELDHLEASGLGREDFAEAARRAGIGRAALESEVASLAALSVRLLPTGLATADMGMLRAASPPVCLGLFRNLAMTIASAAYPPRGKALERLVAAFRDDDLGRGRTLAGCRFAPWRGRLVVARESRGLPGALAISPGGGCRWDRFDCGFRPGKQHGRAQFQVQALGLEGIRQLKQAGFATAGEASLPGYARQILPALWRDGELLAQPQIGYFGAGLKNISFSATFRPIFPLCPEAFTVVSRPYVTI